MEESIRAIKRQFRLRMNGPVAASMREKGLNYKVNFGLTYPQIREIASGLQPDPVLARQLWEEEIRESKILATLLFPDRSMTREEAEKWLQEIPYPEIADYAVMNLFSRLPFAPELMTQCIESENPLLQYTGFMLSGRLWTRGIRLSPDRQEWWLKVVCETCDNKPGWVALAAVNSLERLLAIDDTGLSLLKKLCGSNEMIRQLLTRFEDTEK